MRLNVNMVQTRNAILPDVKAIHAIIQPYAGNGTLLPRTVPELCENIRDFVVAEENGIIIGCGALHLYGIVDVRRAAGIRHRLDRAEVVLAARPGQESAKSLEIGIPGVPVLVIRALGVDVRSFAVHLPNLD